MDRRNFLELLGAASALPFFRIGESIAAPVATGAQPLGLNLASLVYWSTERPFTNLAVGASRWRIQTKGAPFSWDEPLPPMRTDGYPTVVPHGTFVESFLVWTRREKLPDQLLVMYDGKGRIEYLGGARLEARTPGCDRITNLQNDAAIIAQLVDTDEKAPLRNLRVYEHEPAGTFRKAFLDRLSGMTTLRFMDWMSTNNSAKRHWDDRPKLDMFGKAEQGAPLEYMVELCNLLQLRPWFNMPHLADDEYARRFAEQVRDTLAPSLPVYVEYSNEVWNSLFDQANHAREQGLKLGLSSNDYEAQLRYYAQRTTEILSIWEDVFGEARDRVIGVYAAHSANIWTSTTILSWEGVSAHADVLAIAPYFGAGLGSPEQAEAVSNWSMDMVFEALSQEVAGENNSLIRAQADVARQHGLKLVAYEGGQHLVGHGGAENNDKLTSLFIAANRDPRMGELYTSHLRNWWDAGGDVYALFSSMSEPSKWGSWGLQEHEGDTHAKWEAARSFLR